MGYPGAMHPQGIILAKLLLETPYTPIRNEILDALLWQGMPAATPTLHTLRPKCHLSSITYSSHFDLHTSNGNKNSG